MSLNLSEAQTFIYKIEITTPPARRGLYRINEDIFPSQTIWQHSAGQAGREVLPQGYLPGTGQGRWGKKLYIPVKSL